jgi:hypothetical protein
MAAKKTVKSDETEVKINALEDQTEELDEENSDYEDDEEEEATLPAQSFYDNDGDEVLFPDGPKMNLVEEWKSKYGAVYDRAEGVERAALRVSQGNHGGQEEADRGEEAFRDGHCRGGSRGREDPLAEARASTGPAGSQADSGRRSCRRGQRAGETVERRGEGDLRRPPRGSLQIILSGAKDLI